MVTPTAVHGFRRDKSALEISSSMELLHAIGLSRDGTVQG